MMTEWELDDIEENFAQILEHLAEQGRIKTMSAPDGFRFLAWVLRSHPEAEVTIYRARRLH
jgi:hypothetical protein